ncbi:serine/threonine-protein kinase ULK1a [Genypterus blacodes]|uniref:serine/threonine-protein kinase ULK1a n=1 Tax=Genypterus blacodes TaxID=154954 RepID=UPI003F7699B1
METVGKFEFSRKDLIGHGAFAVVFKGRHKEKRDWEVAVKCINKKNLAKSQVLLGKEIKILKELKHDNIVRLLDYQEIGGCVYLVMEYCNGGDLAEYLHSKGTLSEDTIRVFLQQIAQAMKILQSKGILHRDLKPQNILLCHPEGRRSSPNNTCIKIADFGFARHLQTNTMAATLCGSPMYMAPEVIMSQSYDAKADLWSIGTIVFQCLTGKAPFHASTPQELRLFYESNRTLLPSIPRETSRHLRHLLLGLLQKNHKERMSFDEFFHHPFLESGSVVKKCSPAAMVSFPNSGSGSSCSSSSTSHLASPQFSDGEMQRLQPKTQDSPTPDSPIPDSPGFLLREITNQDGRNSSSYTEDYVMVTGQFPNDFPCEEGAGSPTENILIHSGSSILAEEVLGAADRSPTPTPLIRCPSKPVSKPAEFVVNKNRHSVPVPVPTQIHNYQRMEQNLQPFGSSRVPVCCAGGSNGSSPECGGCRPPGSGSGCSSRRSSSGGAQPQQSSPPVGTTPKTSEQSLPLSTRTGLLIGSPDMQPTSSCRRKSQILNPESYSPKQGTQSTIPNGIRRVPHLQSVDRCPASHTRESANTNGLHKRSLSTGRLSEMLLKAAFGAHPLEDGLEEIMETAAPPCGCHTGSPPAAVFTIGPPSRRNTAPAPLSKMFIGSPGYSSPPWLLSSRLPHKGGRRASESDSMDATPYHSLIFHPPALPEDTLMEQTHTDALNDLHFTLAFVHCVMEVASSKDQGLDVSSSPDVSFLEQSLVTDQISVLSREWSYAEQLVLYMKAEEFLSSTLHTAKDNIKQGCLLPSATVKQVIRKLNDCYKSCVTYCRCLSERLQSFLMDKQRLMDRFSALTAEKLIYSHAVHMVQSAALDEMFNYGTTSVQCYHKALLLMEGLSRIITAQKDIDNIDKCKQYIERRLSALQC